jgi:hypothetical protein
MRPATTRTLIRFLRLRRDVKDLGRWFDRGAFVGPSISIHAMLLGERGLAS